ncbi:MAG: hypothetical protein V1839_02555 [archaeon]
MTDEASEAKPVAFSWPGAEVNVIQIGNNSYKTVIVGKCGQLADRIAEAKTKGYIGITISDKNYLSNLANYIENGRFILQKACKGTNLHKFKILGLLDSYSKMGINFPDILYPVTPNPADIFEEPASPFAKNYNSIVQDFKKGRSMERAAIEDLVDILRSQDGEIADIKKRLELLEKKK